MWSHRGCFFTEFNSMVGHLVKLMLWGASSWHCGKSKHKRTFPIASVFQDTAHFPQCLLVKAQRSYAFQREKGKVSSMGVFLCPENDFHHWCHFSGAQTPPYSFLAVILTNKVRTFIFKCRMCGEGVGALFHKNAPAQWHNIKKNH